MTADDFLDADALHILTGCRQKKRQIQVLALNGVGVRVPSWAPLAFEPVE